MPTYSFFATADGSLYRANTQTGEAWILNGGEWLPIRETNP